MTSKTYSERIIEYLKTVSEATPTQIRDNTKVHYEVIKFVLEDLEAKGKVVKRLNDRGKFTYWRLKK